VRDVPFQFFQQKTSNIYLLVFTYGKSNASRIVLQWKIQIQSSDLRSLFISRYKSKPSSAIKHFFYSSQGRNQDHCLFHNISFTLAKEDVKITLFHALCLLGIEMLCVTEVDCKNWDPINMEKEKICEYRGIISKQRCKLASRAIK
jgi:hypothetical protein